MSYCLNKIFEKLKEKTNQYKAVLIVESYLQLLDF